MFEMMNLRIRANQIIVGAWLLCWVVFMIASVVLMVSGTEMSDLFDSWVIVICCIAMAIITGIFSLLVAVQDCIAGETSYTAKGRLLRIDVNEETYELVTKTALRKESPWTFWLIVLCKSVPGILLILVISLVINNLR